MDEDVTILFNLGEEHTTNSPVFELEVSSYFVIIKYLYLTFCPAFLVIGIIGNVLNVIILNKLKFQRNTTYTLLLILALADMTVLFVSMTTLFILHLVDLDLFALSEFSCKFCKFLIYFSMQFSSWILVLVTVVRFMKTVVPLRLSKYKNITVKNTQNAVFVTGVLLIGINLHCFWANGLVNINGKTFCTSLNQQYYYFQRHLILWVNLVLMPFLPALIMIVLNSIICWELRKLKEMRKKLRSGPFYQDKQKSTQRVTWMLVVTTAYYIVACIPFSVVQTVYNYMEPRADEFTIRHFIRAAASTYLFQSSQFALNFYLYTATNQKFRKELAKFAFNAYNRIWPDSKVPRDYSSESRKLPPKTSTYIIRH